MNDSKVIIALDFSDRKSLFNLVDRLEPRLCKLKIGKELFTYFGPDLVKELVKRGYDIFLDLKYHDIPSTVAKACTAAADLGVWMLNVHAQGGRRMLEAAQEAVSQQMNPPKLIAVTVLTSMEQSDLNGLGIHLDPQSYAIELAKLAQAAGLNGIVCSAHEAKQMRHHFGAQFELVTPGIRPSGSDANDQKRIMTPRAAIQSGASYLVIGRPVTQSNDPVSLLLTINSDISDI